VQAGVGRRAGTAAGAPRPERAGPGTTGDPTQALAELAEAVGGYAVAQDGSAIPVEDQVARLTRLRQLTSRPHAGEPIVYQAIRWFLADPATRTISPWSTITVSQPARSSIAMTERAAQPVTGRSP
jgi:hypothetical protein